VFSCLFILLLEEVVYCHGFYCKFTKRILSENSTARIRSSYYNMINWSTNQWSWTLNQPTKKGVLTNLLINQAWFFKKGWFTLFHWILGTIKSFQPRSWDQHVSGNRMREQSQPYAKMLGCWYHIDITKCVRFTCYVCISIYLAYIVFFQSL